MVDNNLVKKQRKHSIAKQKDKIRSRVTATITVTNHIDEIVRERGFIPADRMRCITIDKVLVDTGATRLCLPADIIAQSAFPSLQQRGQRTLLPIAAEARRPILVI